MLHPMLRIPRSSLLFSLLLVIFLAPICLAEDPPSLESQAPSPILKTFSTGNVPSVPPLPAVLPLSENETSWRWIGRQVNALNAGGCPGAPTGWTVSPMFDGFDVPPFLEGFCVYEWTDHPLITEDPDGCLVLDNCEVDTSDLSDLVNSVGAKLLDFRPDQLVVLLSGNSLEQTIDDSIEAFFLKQVGVKTSTSDNTIVPVPLDKPRLAIVDTKPSGSIESGNSPHGDTLTAMAERVLCRNSSCLAEITNYLGLSYVVEANGTNPPRLYRDTLRGGMVGTIGELAQAIFRTVDDWRIQYHGFPNPPPLIINLSVAWDGKRFGDESTKRSDVLSVFRTLQYASCQGALVIGAAGNRSDGPKVSRSKDPMLPAGWEVTPAPSTSFCSANYLGLIQRELDMEPVEAYTPLIYAVAGVNPKGELLINARDDSTPPRVAFGGPAVVKDSDQPFRMAILTGSSVSALVTSIVSAELWSRQKNLSAHQVMQYLDTTGELPILGRIQSPDFCLGGTGQDRPCKTLRPSVRRISLCQALDVGDDCPVWRNQWPNFETQKFESFDNQANVTFNVSNFQGGQAEPNCDDYQFFYPVAPPLEACPAKQYDGIQDCPGVFPQPLATPCPPCTMASRHKQRRQPVTWAAQADGGKLRVEIDSTFDGVHLSHPTLTLCPRSENPTVYSLDGWQPQGGDKALIEGLPQIGCTDATLSFKVRSWIKEGSATNPILVVP